MSLMHKNKEIGGFPVVDSTVTSDSNNPVSSKAVHEAIVNANGNTELCELTLGYTCKNLLPYPYFVSSRTNRGITFTTNQDGSVNFEGVADNELSAYITIVEGDILPAGTYTVSTGSDIYAGLGLYFFDDEGLSIPYSSGYSGLFATSTTRYIYTTADGLVDWKPDNTYGYEKTFTIDKPAFIRVQVRGVDNTCTDTVSGTIYPMIRLASIQDGTFEAYKPTVDTRLNSIDANYNLKTYTVLSQLGLSTGCTLSDVLNAMTDYSSMTLNSSYLASADRPLNAPSDELIVITRLWHSRITIISTDRYGNVCVGKTSYSGTTVAFDGWKKICTTSVTDVPLTTVTIDTSDTNLLTDSSSQVRYLVRNGVCYVDVANIGITTGATQTCGVKFAILPKPVLYYRGAVLRKSGSSAYLGGVYVDGNGEASLWLESTAKGIGGVSSFSYPVAE